MHLYKLLLNLALNFPYAQSFMNIPIGFVLNYSE